MMHEISPHGRDPSQALEVAVVIPTLNEEHGIGVVLDQVKGALAGRTFALLVVDGHSSDRTREIAKEKGAEVVFQRGRGYGDGLLTGFEIARTRLDPEAIVMIDGDGTYDPEDIPRILDPILKGEADLVLGNRFPNLHKDAMSLTNRIGNRVISGLSRHLLGLRVSDSQCGIRAFRSDLILSFAGQAEGMAFATEMLADVKQSRARIAEVPVRYRPRVGATKLNPVTDGGRIIGIILRLLRDYNPLFFFGTIGMILVLIGLVLGSGVIAGYLATGTVTRVPTAILTALLILIGVQFFSLGLVADMIKGIRSRRYRI